MASKDYTWEIYNAITQRRQKEPEFMTKAQPAELQGFGHLASIGADFNLLDVLAGMEGKGLLAYKANQPPQEIVLTDAGELAFKEYLRTTYYQSHDA